MHALSLRFHRITVALLIQAHPSITGTIIIQVVHRKLTLSDSSVKAKSVEGGMDASYDSSAGDGTVSGGVVSEGVVRREAQEEHEEDRRASTGEISVPATLTSVSPLPPQVREDGKQELVPYA